ncbi:hypothetical protein [Thiobacillus sp.]|uniref:hypothetical protein n=1 Tax=Thiobacillus sp. TaxID=924 RepID=UPI0025DBC497|nr:hypothetical protein [Thiobacillus sp.]
MRTRLRRFLLLLLMLTLPAQAFAYSAMQVCILPDRAAMEQMAMPDEAMTMADCHTPDQPQPPPGQHECKFCAACALATALPIGFADSTPVVPIAHRFAPQPAASFSGFIPDSLDRPPRTTLA